MHSWAGHSCVTVLSYHPVVSLPPPPSLSPVDIGDHLDPYHCALWVILTATFFPNSHGFLTPHLASLSDDPDQEKVSTIRAVSGQAGGSLSH